jgi:hypothetical protein
MMRMWFSPRQVDTAQENSVSSPREPHQANLALELPAVDALHDFVGKDFSSIQKPHAMPGEIGTGFFPVPLEFQFQASDGLSL